MSFRKFRAHVALSLLASAALMIAEPAAADAIRGGLLYDKWWAVNGAPEPVTDHPLYPMAGSRTGSTTHRCKECHGWDYKGVDGAYATGSHFTGIPGVFGSTMDPVDMFTLLKSGVVTNGHDFGALGLTDTDIDDLVDFVTTMVIDTDTYIDGGGVFIGDAGTGATNFTSGGSPACTVCHGSEGTNINFGTPTDPDWVGTLAVANPWEVLHKVRFGHPGTGMPSWIGDGGDDQGAADIGLYAQAGLPSVHLCPAEPRSGCLTAAKAQLAIKDKEDDAKDGFKFQWKNGASFASNVLGDPDTETNYAVCVYDRSSDAPALAMVLRVFPDAAWQDKGAKGWKYKEKTGASDGVGGVGIKAGDDGKTKVQVKGKGTGLGLPAPFGPDQFFELDSSVTVQVANESTTCWTADFDTAKSNDAKGFKAKTP